MVMSREILNMHLVASVCQVPAAGLQVDQELDVTIDFISPELPGRYISYWRMASPSGQKFGQRVWVLIQVSSFDVIMTAFLAYFMKADF